MADLLIRNVNQSILQKFRNGTLMAKINDDPTLTQAKMFEIIVEKYFSDQKDTPLEIEKRNKNGLRELQMPSAPIIPDEPEDDFEI